MGSARLDRVTQKDIHSLTNSPATLFDIAWATVALLFLVKLLNILSGNKDCFGEPLVLSVGIKNGSLKSSLHSATWAEGHLFAFGSVFEEYFYRKIAAVI